MDHVFTTNPHLIFSPFEKTPQNLDGLYLVDLPEVLAVAMLTSKGAAGVSGAGFITLAATLGSIHPDRFGSWKGWPGWGKVGREGGGETDETRQ